MPSRETRDRRYRPETISPSTPTVERGPQGELAEVSMNLNARMLEILRKRGVKPIEALNQEFDPNQHEAVIYEDGGDGGDVRVIAELQKGYKLRDRVLRPNMVKVGKA